jgi:hypothetical protein
LIGGKDIARSVSTRIAADAAALTALPGYPLNAVDYVPGAVFLARLVPALLLGVIAFAISSVTYWRSALRNVCYVLALVSWILVLSRVGLLLLTAATSLPALMVHYMAPAYFMMVSGAVFSCAAWLQLSRPPGRSAWSR